METQDAEMQRVFDRLERVERQNRWLVRGGLALAVLCGGVLLMAQKPITRTIEAQGFVLKDAAGTVEAELHMAESGPELVLYGNRFATEAHFDLEKDGPHLRLRRGLARADLATSNSGPSLFLSTGEGGADGSVSLGVGHLGATIWVEGTGNSRAYLTVNKDGSGLQLGGGEGKGTADLTVYGDGPNLALKDLEGFQATIGSTSLVTLTTGEKHQSSAASIHLFGPKGTGLWSAP